jgi:hypothetical protein
MEQTLSQGDLIPEYMLIYLLSPLGFPIFILFQDKLKKKFNGNMAQYKYLKKINILRNILECAGRVAQVVRVMRLNLNPSAKKKKRKYFRKSIIRYC